MTISGCIGFFLLKGRAAPRAATSAAVHTACRPKSRFDASTTPDLTRSCACDHTVVCCRPNRGRSLERATETVLLARASEPDADPRDEREPRSGIALSLFVNRRDA